MNSFQSMDLVLKKKSTHSRVREEAVMKLRYLLAQVLNQHEESHRPLTESEHFSMQTICDQSDEEFKKILYQIQNPKLKAIS